MRDIAITSGGTGLVSAENLVSTVVDIIDSLRKELKAKDEKFKRLEELVGTSSEKTTGNKKQEVDVQTDRTSSTSKEADISGGSCSSKGTDQKRSAHSGESRDRNGSDCSEVRNSALLHCCNPPVTALW